MAMSILNNSATAMALGETNKNTNKLGKALKKVSSGMKINSAGDSAAEYSISEKMRVMVRALGQDIENARKGINLIGVAEKGMSNIIDSLRNLKAMAIDSANGHNTEKDRAIIQKEFSEMMNNINDIASTTNYNGKILLDGRYWYKETELPEVSSRAAYGISMLSLGDEGGEVEAYSIKMGKVSSGITYGATTDIKFDLSSGRVENQIEGLFPPATGVNMNYARDASDYYKDKFEVYSPESFAYMYGTGDSWYDAATGKPYGKVNVGDIVTNRPSKPTSASFMGVVGKEPITDKYVVYGQRMAYNEWVANGSYAQKALTDGNHISKYAAWKSVELDFSTATLNGKSLSYPEDLHGQGFTILDLATLGGTDCKPTKFSYAVSIIFDATIESSDSKLLYARKESVIDIATYRPSAPTNTTTSQYYGCVIGIKGASTADAVEKAVYDGITNITLAYGRNDSINVGSRPIDVNSNAISSTQVIDGVENRGIYLTDYGNGHYVLSAHHGGDSGHGSGLGIYNGVMKMSGTLAELPPSGGDGGTTPPSGGDGGTTPPSGGDGGTTPPSGGDGGTTPPSGGDGGTTPPSGGDGGTTPPDDEWVDKEKLFEGNPLIIHYGPRSAQHLRVYINDMHTSAMGLDDVVVDPREKALEAIDKIDEAIEYALNEATRMGAYQSRLEQTIGNLVEANENITAAESVIRDADMAKEMMEYAKTNVLSQSSQAMLAQSNQMANNVFSLLQ